MSIHRHKYPTAEEAAKACARNVLAVLEETLAGEGEATIAVSGGSTPKLMFEELARTPFSWARVHLFFVDERCVSPSDSQSNFRLAEQSFIVPSHFPRRNVHRIQGELRPQLAAERYAAEVSDFFSLRPGDMPHFDIIHRGIGADCHTASLFPGDPLVEDRENLAAGVFVEKLQSWRVTLLPSVLLNARHTVMLVCGADKAQAVRNVLAGPHDLLKCPAQLTSRRSVTWFLDEAAAVLMD